MHAAVCALMFYRSGGLANSAAYPSQASEVYPGGRNAVCAAEGVACE